MPEEGTRPRLEAEDVLDSGGHPDDIVPVMETFEALVKLAESMQDRVTPPQFAMATSLFLSQMAFGMAPSPMHATRLILGALDQGLSKACDEYEQFIENENEEGDDAQE